MPSQPYASAFSCPFFFSPTSLSGSVLSLPPYNHTAHDRSLYLSLSSPCSISIFTHMNFCMLHAMPHLHTCYTVTCFSCFLLFTGWLGWILRRFCLYGSSPYSCRLLLYSLCLAYASLLRSLLSPPLLASSLSLLPFYRILHNLLSFLYMLFGIFETHTPWQALGWLRQGSLAGDFEVHLSLLCLSRTTHMPCLHRFCTLLPLAAFSCRPHTAFSPLLLLFTTHPLPPSHTTLPALVTCLSHPCLPACHPSQSRRAK